MTQRRMIGSTAFVLGLLLYISPSESVPRPSIEDVKEFANATDGTVIEHPNRRLLLTKCGLFAKDRIIGGHQTEIGQFPWLALLEYLDAKGRNFECGGSLINNRYVLTAAHCVHGLGKRKLIGVRLGEHDLRTDPDCMPWTCVDPVLDVGIEEIIPHPEYIINSWKNDIALIRLDRQVPFTATIKPICLPNEKLEMTNYVGRDLTVAGWGRTENNTLSDVKMRVSVPVVSRLDCEIAHARMGMSESQMCAGGIERKDSCDGDSGGPLMDSEDTGRLVVAGIVSSGSPLCGTKGKPAIYTRVEYYIRWILENMKP